MASPATWAEFYEARFEVPNVGDADTFAYYVEAKYKFTPQLFGAVRWNQQLFNTINNGYGGRHAGVQTLAESTSPLPTVSPRTRS
jgi:hypothetical protein